MVAINECDFLELWKVNRHSMPLDRCVDNAGVRTSQTYVSLVITEIFLVTTNHQL